MVKTARAVLKRIANSPVGHQVGNHSWSHTDFKTLDDAAIKKEITTTQEIIEDTIGNRASRMMRPPYGSATPDQITLIKSLGYEVVLWNVDSKDSKADFPKEPKAIAKEILKDTERGRIVLAHDIHQYTVDAIKIVIPELKRRCFTFATVQTLRSKLSAAAVSPYTKTPGVTVDLQSICPLQ